jgi:hypothetical protein
VSSRPDDVHWLECLIWSEQNDRLARLRNAVRIAQAEPAHLVRGDLNEAVGEPGRSSPPGSHARGFHSAVLAYLPDVARDVFTETMRTLPGHWISNEAPHVLPCVQAGLRCAAPPDRAVFALALDEQPVAFSGPHGQSLQWLSV